jgi:hypothetical protein
MDARDPQQPKVHETIMNPADYVDSLLRPKSDRYVVTKEKIKGRRLRDQYLDEVTVIKVVEPQV